MDKYTRDTLSHKYDELHAALARIRARAPLENAVDLENLDQKLLRLIARFQTAPRGYAGWFDAAQIVDEDLDALTQFDAALASGVPQLKAAIDQIAAAIKSKQGIDDAIGECAETLDNLNAQFNEREQFLATGKKPMMSILPAKPVESPLGDFFAAQSERDETLLGQLGEALDGWLELCAGVQLDEPLPLTVVREAWLGALDQGRLSQRFLAGAVNFCTLMPMRAIPFRMVCLLGMNDGDYPRSVTPLDFDLMAGDYRPGDRSRREDDRYLLLEALLAAREQLYVSWVGRSIRDNSERPASVLVGQLRDHLGSGWTLAGGGDLLHALTTEHPLQPFSRDYFSGADPALFSYAREWADLHRQTAATGEARALPPFQADAPLSLETLQSFLRDPVRHFFTQRLKVHLDEEAQAQLDEEPFGLDALQLYQLRQQLLGAATLALEEGGERVEPALQATALRLQRSGQLPLAGFGARLREQVLAPLPAQMQRYQALCALWPQKLESPRQLPFAHAGVELDGWLGGLRSRADEALARVELQPGELKNKDKSWKWHRLLRPWVAHVAAAACGLQLTSLLDGEDVGLEFEPVARDEARQILQRWLEGWRDGLNAPLPVALHTAIAWLSAEDEDKAAEAARKAYEGGYRHKGEVENNASLARQYPDFDALTADGEFYAWSQDLYQPLLKAAIREPKEEASA